MNARDDALAVIGVDCIFPGSVDRRGFWTDLLAARDLIGDVPEDYWLVDDHYDADPSVMDKTYGRRGAFLDPVDFDALAFGMPPSLLSQTDTSQLLALVVAQRVLDEASKAHGHVDTERVSVVLGVTSAQDLLVDMGSRLQRPIWVSAMRQAGIPEDEVQAAADRMSNHYTPWTEATFPGLLGNVVAGRIANRLDLHGTNCVLDAACASSLSAVRMAADELLLGRSDLVITGGVDTMSGIFMHMCFSRTPALSKAGDVRPFDEDADGTLLGEGLAMFALRRLADAERDGDRIYGVIRGIGTSSDGRSKSVYAPVSEGQARALERAYEQAGYGPETVELVEAHGTGTKAGDAAEVGGLKQVFGEADAPRTALGSVKSQIGHTKAAAGAAGLFKILGALTHRVLPPTAKIDRPNPALGLDGSPFFLNTAARPWVRGDAHPRRASVSAFGFGGSNFHATVEAYEGPNAALRWRTWASEVVPVAAADAAGLVAQARAIAAEAVDGDLRWIAHRQSTTATGEARLVVIASDAADLARKLTAAADRIAAAPGTPWSLPDGTAYGLGAPEGDVAFVFPGQGSQYAGMGADVAMARPEALAVWDRARSLGLQGTLPFDQLAWPLPAFDDITRDEQAEALTRTDHAQPALGLTSLSLLAVLDGVGLRPDAVAGHSFGELVALHAAGVLDRDATLRLAVARGRAMAEAAQAPGAMCAVRADIDSVRAQVADWGLDLVVANHNHPEQVVLSGAVDVVDDALVRFGASGVDAKRLDVATAFHSPIVASATDAFGDAVAAETMGASSVPVWANATAAPYDDAVAGTLVQQLVSPVRWVEVVEGLYDAGVRTFVEVGPHGVLTGLTSRTLGDRPHTAIALDRKGRDGVGQLQVALAALWAEGRSVDLGALWDGYELPLDPASIARPKMAVPVAGHNLDRPYPPAGGAAARPAPNPPRPAVVAAPAPSAPVAPSATPVSARPQEVPVAHDTPPPADAGWLAAFLELQRQTAEAHAQWQAAMSQTHQAFLQTMERSLASLGGTQGVALPPLPAPPAMPVAAPPPLATYAPPVAAPVPAPVAPAPVAAPAPAPVATAAPAPSADLSSLLVAVVAEATGFPPDAVSLEMDLEADLGVDSIKRVEILSTLRERAPGLPEVDAGELASLRTLAQIVEHLGGSAQAPAALPAPATAAPSADLSSLLIAVVAEATGFPPDAVSLEMDLEADLGVDSIKRVEILSTLRERAPGLPEVDAGELASLRTLAQIVDHLGGSAEAPASSGGGDLSGLLVDVVAEATGFPADAVSLGMDLEADLGVDSIKRVEILSTLRERAPGLPEVDAGELASLRTLAQIVEHLGGQPAGSGLTQLSPRASAPVEVEAVGRWKVVLSDAPPSGLGLPGLRAADVQVVGPADVADAVAGALTREGLTATSVRAVDGTPGAVVFVGGVGPFDDAVAAGEVVYDAFAAAKAVAPTYATDGGIFVTVQATGGQLGRGLALSPAAWATGLPGLVKTLRREWTSASVKAIDVGPPGLDVEVVAERVTAELLAGGLDVEVGLGDDGARITMEAVRVPTPSGGAPVLADGDVVVVTGGARGVTAATIIAWAERQPLKFVLLGRTPLADEPPEAAGADDEAALKTALIRAVVARGDKPAPAAIAKQARAILAGREVRGTLAAIDATDAEAWYLPTDVTDAAALGAALDEVRARWGAVAGLVHGAGVLADKAVADKSASDFRWVVETKVASFRLLLDALSEAPLKLVVPFGSVAGRVGNSGQSDYAAANETLARVAGAYAASTPGCVARTLAWGPWAGGMVTPALARHFEASGVALIPLDAGAQAFVAEVHDGADTDEVVLGSAPDEALPTAGPPAIAADLRVGPRWQPELDGHRVGGKAVVPVVFALEWMIRAAQAVRPDLHVHVARDVEVLKGVVVEDEDAGMWLHVAARELQNGSGSTVLVELTDDAGKPRYRATVRLEIDPPTDLAAPGATVATDDDAPYAGGGLFHTGPFQVLRAVGLGAERAAAVVDSHTAAGWTRDAFFTDPAALDGVLQLGVLFTAKALGGPNLPTRVGAYEVGPAAQGTAPLSVRLVGGADGAQKVRYDAWLVDADGGVVGVFRDVVHHALPATRPSPEVRAQG